MEQERLGLLYSIQIKPEEAISYIRFLPNCRKNICVPEMTIQDIMRHKLFILQNIPINLVEKHVILTHRTGIEKRSQKLSANRRKQLLQWYKDNRFPPIIVSAENYLIDGFHRLQHAKEIKMESILAYKGVV